MADPVGGSNGGNQPQAGQPPIMVKGQYIKDFSFENPGAPGIFVTMSNAQPEVNINVHVEAKPMGNGDYEVVLGTNIDAKAGGKNVFVCELSYGGVFTLGPQIPQDQHQPVLLIECPRLLFPFVRQIISDATREGGFPPLLMQPIDFVSLYQQQAGGLGQAPGGLARA
jgi:preprotein translocase subunit SecB